jgi:hypothetical protein
LFDPLAFDHEVDQRLSAGQAVPVAVSIFDTVAMAAIAMTVHFEPGTAKAADLCLAENFFRA